LGMECEEKMSKRNNPMKIQCNAERTSLQKGGEFRETVRRTKKTKKKKKKRKKKKKKKKRRKRSGNHKNLKNKVCL